LLFFLSFQIPSFLESPSQTSSRHTYPFICTPDSDLADNSSHEKAGKEHDSTAPNSTENTIDPRSSSSSLERFSANVQFNLPSGTKAIISKEGDQISTNYDSDDGWSDDSAELIYVDERYTQKKKIISSSSSHHHHHHYLLSN
jgi:hypothetical protein